MSASTEPIQNKVKFHMNALEEHVKNGNLFLNQSDRLFDSVLINSFMENHLNLMVHHLLALKIQLERFRNLNEEMEEKRFVGDVTDGALNRKERKRSEEHKNRVKALRFSKTESLKYVLQWENLMDDHKNENIFNNVQMRSKTDKNRLDRISEDRDLTEDVSKVMVTKRVQLFEGFKKPKRVSSTVEAFLENANEKSNICSILENLEEEDEDFRNSARLSKGFDQNLPKTKDQIENILRVSSAIENLKKVNREDVKSSKIEKDTLINSNRSVTEDFSLTADNEISKQSIQNSTKNSSESKYLNNNKTLDVETENCKSSESVSTKPRIVQVHYKQNSSMNYRP